MEDDRVSKQDIKNILDYIDKLSSKQSNDQSKEKNKGLFNTTLNIGNIITAISVLIGLGVTYGELKSNFSKYDLEIKNIKEQVNYIAPNVKDNKYLEIIIKEKIENDINSKLEKIKSDITDLQDSLDYGTNQRLKLYNKVFTLEKEFTKIRKELKSNRKNK